jgi:Arm DNA-binding domain
LIKPHSEPTQTIPHGRLSARSCETAKPNASAKDRLLGDGDGLFLRVRPSGTKTWNIEYEFQERRRKFTIGVFGQKGAAGESITTWLENGDAMRRHDPPPAVAQDEPA